MSCGLVSNLIRLLDGYWSSVLPSIGKMSGMIGFVTEEKHLQISLAQFVRCNRFPS